MRKIVGLLVVLLFACSAYAVTADYSVVVEESGNSNIILTVKGKGIANIPLPSQHSNLRVTGGSYDKTDTAITFELFSDVDSRIVSFSTSSYTQRTSTGHRYVLPLMNCNASEIGIAIPTTARSVVTNPEGFKSHGRYLWNFLSRKEQVAIEYSLPGMTTTTTTTPSYTPPVTTTTTTTPPVQEVENKGTIQELVESADLNVLGLAGLIVGLVIIAGIITFLLVRK